MNIKINYPTYLAITAALGGFLFGYDAAVISGTIKQVTHQFNLDTLSEGWYVGCALIGSIFGVSIGGILGDKFGRKNILILSGILFAISAFWCMIAGSFQELVNARIIGGIGIGIVSIISPLYISEISIPENRGKMVTLYQLAITIGFLGAYLINFILLNLSHDSTFNPIAGSFIDLSFKQEVWRSMLGLATLPSILFIIIILFIPESPRWLILKNHESKAEAILQKIFGTIENAKIELNKTKEAIGQRVESPWKEIRKPGILKAVLIGAAIAILGQFMGVNAVLYYGPSIFESSGMSSGDSLYYQVIVGLVNVLTTVLAVFIIDKVGRKKLVYYGVSAMIVSLVLIALYFQFGKSLNLSSVYLLCFFLFYIFSCAISISAVIFVLLSEMFPIKVRGLAMSIAGFSLWAGTYLIGQLTPVFLETLKPAGTFYFFAAMCIPYIIIVWKLIPETTGKPLEEIEKFWH